MTSASALRSSVARAVHRPIAAHRRTSPRDVGKRIIIEDNRHIRTGRAAIALLLGFVGAVPASGAQQQTDTTRLAPVVVTASRTGTTQHTSTAATTVLRGDALRARGIATLAAALREIPGMTVAQTAGRGSQTSVFLRGGEADYVQVIVDGVTVNEPGGAVNLATLSLDDVERIEIVRGPTSVLYGANAVTGVIQIFTRRAGQGASSNLLLRAGSRGAFDTEGGAGGRLGSRASWRVGGGFHRSSGVHDLNNDSRMSTLGGRLQLVPFVATAVDLTARYSDARYNYPTEFYGAPLDSNSYTTDRRLTVGADLVHALRPSIDVRVSAGLSRLQNITNDPLDQRTDSFDDGSPVPFESRSLRRSASAQLDARVLPGGTVTLGGAYDWQELESAGENPGTDPLLERWSRGVFAQVTGDAGARVSYSVGTRAEENERFGSLQSVRAAIGIRLMPSTSVRGSMGSAFKEPQFLEITGGGFALPNATLRPERSRGWEVGIEQRLLDERVALAATRFDQEFSGMIVYMPIPVSEGYSAQYRNAQAADAAGWEYEVRVASARGVSVRANHTVVEGEFQATAVSGPAPLPRRASRTTAVSLAAPIGTRVLLNGDYTHTGPRHDVRFFPADPYSRPEVLPSYDLVAIGATYRLPRRRSLAFELTARIDNLLDERYEAIAGFATERRTGSVGVRVTRDP